MKQYLFIIMAAVLISTMASSCGKQSNSDTAKDSVKTAMNMAKSDTVNGGGQPNNVVSAAPDRANSQTKGIKVTGSGQSPATNATFTVTNSAGNKAYNYMSWSGTNNNASDSSSSSGGVSSWTQGPDSPLPIFWYPLFQGANGKAPTAWTGYDNITINADTVTCTSTAFPAANITITVQGGGGGPH